MAPISDENKESGESASVSEPQYSTSGFPGITPGEELQDIFMDVATLVTDIVAQYGVCEGCENKAEGSVRAGSVTPQRKTLDSRSREADCKCLPKCLYSDIICFILSKILFYFPTPLIL
ncbi:hypothetical protein E2C01_066026 [Portunus trituberculatus]|uniref:Uncharacterized protein n=1 Tax=Portunus trituberculatus TaxID=210409 RepID=A0A5B7HH54_PORTR|nr:hypothetical protein [Portunus trituberculatus]